MRVFEEAVMRMMDEGHTVDVIYLNFVKVFDSLTGLESSRQWATLGNHSYV